MTKKSWECSLIPRKFKPIALFCYICWLFDIHIRNVRFFFMRIFPIQRQVLRRGVRVCLRAPFSLSLSFSPALSLPALNARRWRLHKASVIPFFILLRKREHPCSSSTPLICKKIACGHQLPHDDDFCFSTSQIFI